MSVRPDSWIIKQCRDHGMIEPFIDEAVKSVLGHKIISYGVSAYGYDIRAANEFKLFNVNQTTFSSHVDPKIDSGPLFTTVTANEVLLPPNSMMLCRSLEYFRIPRDVLCVATGKSTYARCGVVANITPLEPEWEGFLTISLSNTSPLPVKIYAFEGIAQLMFHQTNDVCTTSYKDKGGKYMKQNGITGGRV